MNLLVIVLFIPFNKGTKNCWIILLVNVSMMKNLCRYDLKLASRANLCLHLAFVRLFIYAVNE